MDLLKGLSLFSGIGGIDLALHDYVKPVAYCEIEPYCQSVLLQRMQEGNLPKAPIWDDIRTLSTGSTNREASIDIIYGGFPCQDISVAGAGKGLAGERSGLFFEIVRLAKEIKPKFIFLENVPAITTRGGLLVVKEIATLGYDCRWCIISAASVGALHRRERWFLLAYAQHDGEFACERGESIGEGFASRGQHMQAEGIGEVERTSGLSRDVAHANSERRDEESRGKPCGLQEEYAEPANSNFENDSNSDSITSEQTDTITEFEQAERGARGRSTGQYWPFESLDDWQKIVCEMGKCVDGISAKLDFNTEQLRALGNAVVPQQVRKAFELLMGIK